MKRLLYFAPFATGGLADYAHEQANALAEAGVDIEMASVPGFSPRTTPTYQLTRSLMQNDSSIARLPRTLRRVRTAAVLLRNASILVRWIKETRAGHVLLGSYSEYLAPLWAGHLRQLAGRGVIFGAVIHDPVRDYEVGGTWWHRRSIAAGYSFLREAFVHEETSLDTVVPAPLMRTSVVPHGVFSFPQPVVSREQTRARMGIPKDATVLLSFGHVRDGKNLDLVLRAMTDNPELFLVVAGKEQSAGQKPVAFYQQLASELGIALRCKWVNEFIPREEVGAYFQAADYNLLAYSANFRSASGVLNTGVFFRKPCIASSGEGNLGTVVRKYKLGFVAEPDSVQSLAATFRRSLTEHLSPDWEGYDSDNSWAQNARIVRDRMSDR